MSGEDDLSCKDIERAYGDSGCKCVHYRNLRPDGGCEGCSVSDHSPGTVKSDETLCRFLLPKHIRTGTSTIASSAFLAVETLGLSVIRRRYVSVEGLKHRVLAYAKSGNVPPSDVVLAMARCGDVKAITLFDGRGFRVYDTATEHDPAHADVCRALVFPPGTPNQKSHFRQLRRSLAEVFTVTRRFPG